MTFYIEPSVESSIEPSAEGSIEPSTEGLLESHKKLYRKWSESLIEFFQFFL